MTFTLAAALVLAGLGSVALASAYLTWPRGLTAEEWILHRRAVSMPHPAPAPAAGLRIVHPRWLRPPDEVYRTLSQLAQPDLALLRAFGVEAPKDDATLFAVLVRQAIVGGSGGIAAGLMLWVAQGRPLPPWVLIEVTVGCLALYPALTWIRVRRQAAELRSAIENRLPRLLTAARMLLESGAATPERALTEAAAIHDDPAADVVREALRLREVRRLEIEDAVDEVAGRYRISAMTKLADGFRVGRRYGTGMARLLGEHALDLRAYQHQVYRERITRAPVVMTVPALIFFVGPLLVLIMYLVFSPLFHTLSQL